MSADRPDATGLREAVDALAEWYSQHNQEWSGRAVARHIAHVLAAHPEPPEAEQPWMGDDPETVAALDCVQRDLAAPEAGPTAGEPKCEGRTPFDCGNPMCPAHPATPDAGDASTCGHPNHGLFGHDCRNFLPASTSASEPLSEDVEALARVINPSAFTADFRASQDGARSMAHAVLASDWLAADRAATAERTLREAADDFEDQQRRKTRERQELHVWSVACGWLRDRAARIARGEGR